MKVLRLKERHLIGRKSVLKGLKKDIERSYTDNELQVLGYVSIS